MPASHSPRTAGPVRQKVMASREWADRRSSFFTQSEPSGLLEASDARMMQHASRVQLLGKLGTSKALA